MDCPQPYAAAMASQNNLPSHKLSQPAPFVSIPTILAPGSHVLQGLLPEAVRNKGFEPLLSDFAADVEMCCFGLEGSFSLFCADPL